MLVQAFYLFNSFSLLWNRRGAPRDHQCFVFFFLAQAELPKYRSTFLSDHKVISEWGGFHIFPEWAFNIQAGSDSQQKRDTLPFCFPTFIWWEATKQHPDQCWCILSLTFHLTHTLTIKTISDKNTWLFLFSLSLFFSSLPISAPLTSARVFVASFQIIAFYYKSRIKKDD